MQKPKNERQQSTTTQRRVSKSTRLTVKHKSSDLKIITPLQATERALKEALEKHLVDKLFYEAEIKRLNALVKNRNKELLNTDRLVGELHNACEQLNKDVVALNKTVNWYKKQFRWYEKQFVDLTRCLMSAYKKEIELFMSDGWKPRVKAFIEANQLPVHLN
jgi:chromosome segregation ATPase